VSHFHILCRVFVYVRTIKCKTFTDSAANNFTDVSLSTDLFVCSDKMNFADEFLRADENVNDGCVTTGCRGSGYSSVDNKLPLAKEEVNDVCHL